MPKPTTIPFLCVSCPIAALVCLLNVPTGTEAASKHKLRQYGEADLPLLACIALAEGAAEGEHGLDLILATMHNRGYRWNQWSYSAQARLDLHQFCSRQPTHLRQDTINWLNSLYHHMEPPISPATHYVASWLYCSPKRPAWVGRMRVIQVYRNHVFMVEPS